jgi:cellulose biosynthesis protein BcsQ
MAEERSREVLLDDFVQKTSIPNVDIIPASIADGFMASVLERIAREQGVSPTTLLLDRVIKPLEDMYDIILVDTGPHLDAFMLNAFRAATNLLIPMSPTSVDIDSSLRFLMRLPEITALAYDLKGSEELANLTDMRLQNYSGFMSKYVKSAKSYQTLVKQLFGPDFLKYDLPDLVPFRKCGDSYDTVFSVSPTTYEGDSSGSLKGAIAAAQDFTYCVFEEIAVAQQWKLERHRG